MCTGCSDELNSSSATCLRGCPWCATFNERCLCLKGKEKKNPGHAEGELRCIKGVDDVQETLPPLCLPVGMME